MHFKSYGVTIQKISYWTGVGLYYVWCTTQERNSSCFAEETTKQKLLSITFRIVILLILLYKVVLTFESVEKSYGVTIQMKSTEQYFPVMLFILLYKVVLTFESVEKSYGVTIQMKASEKYFPVVLFIMLYKVVLTFESVNEMLWCDHSNESFWEVFSCGTVYSAVQGGSNFWVCERNAMVWPFKWKLLRSIFL